ncbi:MAG: cupin domain-containing protein [Nitrospirota bacterium]|nr:cupin domain-containing protein [Nitrospirota bacterium]
MRAKKPLAGTSPAQFLREYWQKKPLLVRGAFPRLRPPLEPEELAGLALEEEVNSRIVRQHGPHGEPWHAAHGPFTEDDFASLPETGWTLLVQEVNHHVPKVADLLTPFSFLPAWRLDDVMVSYAAEGGGVGPHTDSYDVFLIQAQGRRRWRIAPAGTGGELVDGLDVQILSDFQPTEEWVLEPGDMLYLPPGVPHDGEAVDGPCMTCSVGFRAPSVLDLLGCALTDAARRINPEARYTDPDLTPQKHPGWIGPEAVDKARRILEQAILDPDTITGWFGQLMTEPRRGSPPDPELGPAPEEAAALLDSGQRLIRHPASRWAWSEPPGGPVLFVDGTAYPLPHRALGLATLLSGKDDLTRNAVLPFERVPEARALLIDLIRTGALLPDEEEEDE